MKNISPLFPIFILMISVVVLKCSSSHFQGTSQNVHKKHAKANTESITIDNSQSKVDTNQEQEIEIEQGETNTNTNQEEEELICSGGLKNGIFNKHCYILFKEPETGATWEDAKAACENKNGYLTTLTTEEEDKFVGATIFNEGTTESVAWIGLNDKEIEGTWKWVTGEKFEYSNWAAIEPNNDRNEDCAGYWLYQGEVKWGDSKCKDHPTPTYCGFICEFNTSPNIN